MTAITTFMMTRPMNHVNPIQYSQGSGLQPGAKVRTQAFGWAMRHFSRSTSYFSVVSNRSAGVHHDPSLNQSPSCFSKSCMISFHASPVDARNSVMNPLMKCSKFPCPSCVSDSWLMVENRLTPNMLNRTRNSMATMPTLASFATEMIIDLNNLLRFCKALYLRSLNKRAMRNIRITDATEDTLMPVSTTVRTMPTIVAITHTKSKVFQESFQ
mmetsp:Transcript_22481/g.67360  ORF Transcript_22481/g.67360 Transcript_22481/m.67360 type:complete len:213 (-) Transcript_22481:2045-2683(-)